VECGQRKKRSVRVWWGELENEERGRSVLSEWKRCWLRVLCTAKQGQHTLVRYSHTESHSCITRQSYCVQFTPLLAHPIHCDLR
jgi:hypothetical protein